jgi:hypothetical protein
VVNSVGELAAVPKARAPKVQPSGKRARFVKVSGAEAKGQARSHDPAMVLSSVVVGE